MTKPMNILSINDQDYEVVDADGRSDLGDIQNKFVNGSIIGSASGSSVTVDASAAPLHSCVVQLLPIQAGSGDPTPDNVREITAHTMCILTVNGSDINIFFDPNYPTCYGGFIDVKTGLMTFTHQLFTYDSIDRLMKVSGTQNMFYTLKNPSVEHSERVGCLSNKFRPVNEDEWFAAAGACYVDTQGRFFFNTLKNYESLIDMFNDIGTMTFCTDLKEDAQFTVQLTPEQVETILGQNTLSVENANISIEYYKNISLVQDLITLMTDLGLNEE